MAPILHFIFLILASTFLHATSSNQIPEAYVVYMGSTRGGLRATDEAHLQMLASIIPSEEKERVSITHSYNHAFKGFSAMLTEDEAEILSSQDGVVNVFRDRILQLHTTRSWDFLEAESGLSSVRAHGRGAHSDVIIGVIDTGIWPESPSFDDTGMGEIPSRWKGVCMEGSDFKKSDCNRKLIGARYYDLSDSSTDGTSARGTPRDSFGHGTHTASTAAGTAVTNASYYGLAQGVATGGSPSSRIAMYKACSSEGCSSSAILKAIDDAVSDGVDMISISLGTSSASKKDFLSDPIAIGSFHAIQKGILVVCSAGNDGPDPFTVKNTAPWILTVGASSIDRSFQSSIVLGNGEILKGIAINFSNHTHRQAYPLIFGRDAAAESTPVSDASNCFPSSLDAKKTAGKIVICVHTNPSLSKRIKKLVVEDAKAKGMILIHEKEKQGGAPFDSGSFPYSEVGGNAGAQIFAYINSTKNPTAIILATKTVNNFKPAPVVADFSSRGPGKLTQGILKPDIMAPGVGILAAAIPVADSESDIPAGRKISNFRIESGTSMACPHVAGAAAFVLSAHPRWSPSMIRSALMTTATFSNNLGKPPTTSSGASANYHDTGSGEVSHFRALSPGLVFETTTHDYLNFLCYYGYKDRVVGSLAGASFSCPAGGSAKLISNVNYPSISVARLDGRRRAGMTVTRTVTNVGPSNSTYVATVDAPAGILVEVSPSKLAFAKRGVKASYEVKFEARGAKKGYGYGTVTWSDGAHLVRTVFAVNVV